MRVLWIGMAVLAATATPALANGIRIVPGHLIASTNDVAGTGIPTVYAGDQFAIACNDITPTGADVRVVMALDNPPGEQPTGYSAVLATNQEIVRHSVRVQVPSVPDLANHTVNVKVYVTDAKGTKACDAGRVHIG